MTNDETTGDAFFVMAGARFLSRPPMRWGPVSQGVGKDSHAADGARKDSRTSVFSHQRRMASSFVIRNSSLPAAIDLRAEGG